MFRSFVVKYNFIDDLYKDEFKNKSKELINNLCSEYPGLLNDLSDCLDEENYKFFDFMMLGE